MDAVYKYFHAVDFFIFAAMLSISAAVGIFFAYRDRRRQSTENYYFGGRKISPVPVALSLSLSFVSAITVIGYPVEVYLFGIAFAWIVLSQLFGVCFTAVYFIPLFRRLNLNSIYEYLEMRFHRRVRTAISVIGIIDMIAYMGITVYLPSLALSAVTPLSVEWTIVLTSAVCTFYTALGGVKAVIWTDVLQSSIMVVGIVAVFARTVYLVGGFAEMIAVAERGGRDNFLRFDIDPRVRSGFWTLGLAYSINEISLRGCNQVCMQRYLCCKSTRSARMALLLAFIPTAFYTLMAIACGVAMYAYYEGCDPVMAYQVEKSDQILPRLAVEIFQDVPGIAGLFVSAAFCGTLSTLSSGINSLSALFLLDFILPCCPNLTMRTRMILDKTLSVLFGVTVTAIAFVINLSASNIVQIAFTLLGTFDGPVLGLFLMAAFMPWINHKGALVGLISSWAMAAWVAISALNIESKQPTWEKLPLSTEFCNVSTDGSNGTRAITEENVPLSHAPMTDAWENVTSLYGTGALTTYRPPIYDTLYSISPFLYSTFGFVICVTVGNVVTFITGMNETSSANPALFLPLFTSKFLPRRVIKFFRFGVPEIEKISFGERIQLKTNCEAAETHSSNKDAVELF